MHITTTRLSELVVALLLGTSVMICATALALRFAVRPFLEDWMMLRS